MRIDYMLKVVQALSDIYEICYGAPTFMSAAEVVALEGACLSFGRNYQWLAVFAMRANERRWAQRPKHHYMAAHFAWQARLINPIKVQGYCNESMVGNLSLIYKKSMRGPHHEVSTRTVLKKWCAAMIIEWSPGKML